MSSNLNCYFCFRNVKKMKIGILGTRGIPNHYGGFEQLSYHISINCFKNNPSIKSSLTFLRKTPWAREKVEKLYIETL